MFKPNIEDAKKALKKLQDLEYTLSTNGWKTIEEEIEKELKWAFDESIKPEFAKKVKEKPESYFEHLGYCNGLKKYEDIIRKHRLIGEKARKDVEKWESKNNQAS